MPQKQNTAIQEWVNTILKSLAVALISLGVFVFTNLNRNVEQSFFALNETIKGLTTQLKAMETHQIDTDKRVAAIEVAREINMSGYQKLISDVQEMKNTMLQNTMRLQTISDFVSKHFK